MKVLASLLFAISIIGCNPPSILITQRHPFHPSRISSIAIIPFYGNVTDCAEEARRVLESRLINYFTIQGIRVAPVDMDVDLTIPDIINMTGVLSKKKGCEICKLLEVDTFISGSISECFYYDPDIGEGSVTLVIKIYDGKTGDLLLMVSGNMIVENDSQSVSQITDEIVNTMFENLEWK